jgi:hypothetical protein
VAFGFCCVFGQDSVAVFVCCYILYYVAGSSFKFIAVLGLLTVGLCDPVCSVCFFLCSALVRMYVKAFIACLAGKSFWF